MPADVTCDEVMGLEALCVPEVRSGEFVRAVAAACKQAPAVIKGIRE